MTKQESFKRRIRARMENTGERYAAARHSLERQATTQGRRVWLAEPEFSDSSVVSSTGKGWDGWCDTIEAWPGHGDGHTAIATHLREVHGVDAWWAQSITVGFERITGLRRPSQHPDGTFTANKSKTILVNSDDLRSLLRDDNERADLFPGVETELRSKPASKAIRLAMGAGVAVLRLEPKPDGRTKVTVAHEKLALFDDVAEWKFYWAEWLEALDEC